MKLGRYFRDRMYAWLVREGMLSLKCTSCGKVLEVHSVRGAEFIAQAHVCERRGS